jgi:hypothetical protein
MKKLISIIIGFFTLITSIAAVYFMGSKRGLEKATDEQIKQDNKNLSNEVQNLEKAKQIDNTTAMASDDDIINGLRDCVSKDNSGT